MSRLRPLQILLLLPISLVAHASGFPKLTTVRVGVNPISAQGGDLNGDGKNDLVVANHGNSFGGQGTVHGTLSVVLGKGDGTFQATQTIPLVSDPATLILADFDGDNHLDVLVGGSFRDESFIEFRHGNGDGTFAPSKVFSVPFGLSPSVPLAAADFNGDGKLDLVSILEGLDGVGIVTLLGNGDGTFGAPRTTMLSTLAFTVSDHVAIGDFDNDGKLDVALTFNDGLSVNLGNGDGTFQTLSFFSEPGLHLGRLVSLDFNGDGRLDLVIEGFNSTFRVFLGSGDGTFHFSQAFSSGTFSQFLAAADINGDGKPDVIVGDSTQVTVFQNNGTAPPRALRYSLGIVNGFSSIKSSLVVEDLNNDGNLDLIAIGGFKPGIAVIAMGTGQGELNAPRTFRTARSLASLAIADFNGDGRSDVVTLNVSRPDISPPSGAIFVTKGLGTGLLGSYRRTELTGFQLAPCCLAVADFNNDGTPDVLFVNRLPEFPQAKLSVLLGHRDLSLDQPFEYTLPGGFAGSAIGDFNRDGKLDIAVSDSTGVQILLGNGDGSFRAGSLVSAPNVRQMAAADFNRDGKLDLVVGPGPSVLLGNGDGTFRRAPDFTTGELASVIAADVNGDSIPDILIIDQAGLSVFPGKGDGTFQPAMSTTFKVGGNALVAADFNRDGKLDVAVIQDLGSSPAFQVPVATVLYGRGDGTFRAPVPIVAGGTVTTLSVADMDRNGTPDLIVSGGSGLITILLNKP